MKKREAGLQPREMSTVTVARLVSLSERLSRRVGLMLLCAACVVAASPAQVDGQDDASALVAVRIVAQRHADQRVEFALQQQGPDGGWGSRLLPRRRFVRPDAPAGGWLFGSALTLPDISGEVRIAVHRNAAGVLQVALQRRSDAGNWGHRLLPTRRLVPAQTRAGRWLASSPLLLAGASPGDGAADIPAALITPTGVPVVVLGRAEGGILVRTPCDSTAVILSGVPLEGVRVMIDPGHGGPWASGAIGANGLVERDLNLTLGRAVLRELIGRGIAAATTRTGDYGLRLSVRAELANALGVDALISIHHNAPTWGASDSPGTEVYVQSAPEGGARAASARLGGLLYEEITAALDSFDGITWSRLPNAGVLRVLYPHGGDAYGMVHGPTVPAVLVEYGYISNAPEAELFDTEEYIRAAATATADAVEAYLQTDRSGSGFIDQPRIFDPATPRTRCVEVALE